jgi:hypothetical protein
LQFDDNFKKLLKDLGNAINNSIADSAVIADVMEQIRAEGYDVFLVLEVTIGVNKREIQEPRRTKRAARGLEIEFRLTNQDSQFLRALNIRVEDTKK